MHMKMLKIIQTISERQANINVYVENNWVATA